MSATVLLAACSYTPPDGAVDGPALPSVEFRDAMSLADENVAMLTIPVVLSEPSTSSVEFRVTGGLATADSDFVLVGGGGTTGTLTFSGDTANIEIMFASDGLEEPDETIVLELENPDGAVLGDQTTHTVTISSDILPRVKFTNATTEVAEDLTANAKLDLELDIAPTSDVSVEIVIDASSSAASNDFGLTTQTVTFARGVTTAQLDYAVVADTRDENDDVILVDLASPIGLVIDTTSAHTEHTILDDDDPPTVAFVNGTNTQSESVPTADQVVQLSAASDKMVTVQYAASGQASGAADLTVGGNGTLTFTPGQTTQDIPLTIENDLLDEGASESATITLSNPVNATLGATSTHVLTITDDDDPPTVQFGAPSTSVTEGAVATIDIPVTLSAPSGLTVTVTFATNGSSTAVTPGDFSVVNATTTLTFTPGDTSELISLTLVDDAAGEADETIVFDLTGPTNATLGAQASHTVAIADDDCLGSGNFRVCLGSPPAGTKNLSGPLDTTSSGECANQQPAGWTTQFGQPAACFVIANNITINGTLTVTGTRPLVLVAGNNLTVNNNIDASANGVTHGPAGPSSACGSPSNAENHSDGGGGGAGGSFMSKGGNGGDGDNSDSNADGGNSPNQDNNDPTALRGGCAGQRGGNGPGTGGNGGGAGGAVYLIGNNLTIGATVDVSGSNGLGGASDAGAGGGGGSGGMLVVDALVSLSFDGVLMANGGGAGQGADSNTTGGNGADPVAPNSVALGGNLGSAGGRGGNGFITGTAAETGIDGGSNQGAGGGGGGGGFIRSTRSLAGGTVSAGKIVAP